LLEEKKENGIEIHALTRKRDNLEERQNHIDQLVSELDEAIRYQRAELRREREIREKMTGYKVGETRDGEEIIAYEKKPSEYFHETKYMGEHSP
jgi:hypothetical protein